MSQWAGRKAAELRGRDIAGTPYQGEVQPSFVREYPVSGVLQEPGTVKRGRYKQEACPVVASRRDIKKGGQWPPFDQSIAWS